MEKKKILFIDDDEEILDIINLKLKKNYNILVASSADEAVNMLRRSKIDAIVCDIMMPGITGYELLHAFKSVREDFIFIIYTGKANVSFKEKMVSKGVDGFVLKPNMEELNSLLLNYTKQDTKYFSDDEIEDVIGYILD